MACRPDSPQASHTAVGDPFEGSAVEISKPSKASSRSARKAKAAEDKAVATAAAVAEAPEARVHTLVGVAPGPKLSGLYTLAQLHASAPPSYILDSSIYFYIFSYTYNLGGSFIFRQRFPTLDMGGIPVPVACVLCAVFCAQYFEDFHSVQYCY